LTATLRLLTAPFPVSSTAAPTTAVARVDLATLADLSALVASPGL